jgi:hypothetical protein
MPPPPAVKMAPQAPRQHHEPGGPRQQQQQVQGPQQLPGPQTAAGHSHPAVISLKKEIGVALDASQPLVSWALPNSAEGAVHQSCSVLLASACQRLMLPPGVAAPQHVLDATTHSQVQPLGGEHEVLITHLPQMHPRQQVAALLWCCLSSPTCCAAVLAGRPLHVPGQAACSHELTPGQQVCCSSDKCACLLHVLVSIDTTLVPQLQL